MKSRIVLLACLVLCAHGILFAQIEPSSIKPVLTEKPWLDKDVKIINGYAITQVYGEETSAYRHMNFGPITSIAYNSPDDLLAEAEKEAMKMGWSDEELMKQKDFIHENAMGGAVDVYVTRYKESKANFRYFLLVIRNEDDKKVSDIRMKYKAPQMPEGNGWWNFERVYLPEDPGMPFFVYLNDDISEHLTNFKFEVSVNK